LRSRISGPEGLTASRDRLRQRLANRVLKAPNDESIDEPQSADVSFIEVGSQVRRRNSLNDADASIFLEFDEESEEQPINPNGAQKTTSEGTVNEGTTNEESTEGTTTEGTPEGSTEAASQLNSEETIPEPSGESVADSQFNEVSSKIKSLKKKRKPLIEQDHADNQADKTTKDEFAEVQSVKKIAPARKPQKKRPVASDVDVEARRLKSDIAKADKLSAQLETLIKSRHPKQKVGKRASFLDVDSTITENDSKSDLIESLPSIEALRKKLAANEPQF